MKAVILAGGLGTRLAEETSVRPKPMVEIGGEPILWHIMKIYASHGIKDFVICCGYKGFVIKDYFANYYLRHCDITFDLANNTTSVVSTSIKDDWRVTLVDTGDSTLTGGRLRRIKHLLDDEPFCATYGDGVSDVDITALVAFHKAQGRLATLTAVQPDGRFGAIQLDAEETQVHQFSEKPRGDGAWINGGFFVLDPKVMDYIDGDTSVWEQAPMRNLAHEGQLSAYRHEGFWQSMDTLRDKQLLEELWQSGSPPWKRW
jgi:glucose-1-phosphate cytidylyltransferase